MPSADNRFGAAEAGERERFERCFRAHYADVLAFSMRRVSSRDLAEEVAADTFAVAWRRRDRIPDSPLPWLYGVARRVIANQHRSVRRRRDLDVRLELEGGVTQPAADLADALGRRDAFFTAFSHLSESEREVLRLVAWDGLSTAAAARVLGCSGGAFRVRFHRARRKLAKQLRAAGHIPIDDDPAPAGHAKETR